MRAVSVPTDLETVPDDEDEELSTDTLRRETIIRPQTANGTFKSYSKSQSHGDFDCSTATPTGSTGRRRPASIQLQTSQNSSVGNTTFGQDGSREETLAKLTGRSVPDSPIQAGRGEAANGSTSPCSTVSRRLSLLKPGVSYRIRPKRISMTSTGRVSVASARSDGTGIFYAPAPAKHDRIISTSTEGSDLITPLPSMDRIDKAAGDEEILHASGSEDGEDVKDKHNDDGQEVDKRMSTFSTMTVTFGQ
jgi:hypothetical protein